SRMGAGERGEIHAADLRINEVCRRRLLRTFQELLAVDDLQDAAGAAAVTEIDAVDLRQRDRPVQFGRHRSARGRLLPGQTEIANLRRLCRITKVIDFGHALDAPSGDGGNQIGNAGVAFPPALLRYAMVAAD